MRYLFILMILVLSIVPSARANDGAGLMTRDLDGALPKSLWRGAPYSQILDGIESLPIEQPLDNLQTIQKNMLLSVYDTDRIVEDRIEGEDQRTLLTVRLEKLMEMGLWQESLKLLTAAEQNTDGNETLARLKILLLLLNHGLGTACLEQKVLAADYTGAFWDQIKAVCNAELSDDKPIMTQLGESPLLYALYFEDHFSLVLNDIAAPMTETMLESAMLFLKSRVTYPQTDDLKLSPVLHALIALDPKAPESLKTLSKESDSPLDMREKDNAHTPESFILQNIVTKILEDAPLTEQDLDDLSNHSEKSPNNKFYIATIQKIFAIKSGKFTQKDISNLSYSFTTKKYENYAKILQTYLDNGDEFSNNPTHAYEKHSGLALLHILNNFQTEDETSLGDGSENVSVLHLKKYGELGLNNTMQEIAKDLLIQIMNEDIKNNNFKEKL